MSKLEEVRQHVDQIVRDIFDSHNESKKLTPEILEAFFVLNNYYGLVKFSGVNESTINESGKDLYRIKVLAENTLRHLDYLDRKRFTSYPGKDAEDPYFTQLILNGSDPLKTENEWIIKIVAEAIVKNVKSFPKPPTRVTPTRILTKIAPLILKLKTLGVSLRIIAAFLCEIGHDTSEGAIKKTLERLRQTPPQRLTGRCPIPIVLHSPYLNCHRVNRDNNRYEYKCKSFRKFGIKTFEHPKFSY